jgi:hypothetical protein
LDTDINPQLAGETTMIRKTGKVCLSVLLTMGALAGEVMAADDPAMAEAAITVYKTPTCGCCKKWVSHLEENGFTVESIDMNDLRMIKSMSGISPQNASCHTAKVGGYVVEGHVPADDIKRLLAERPDIRGLAVPGMPMGSPGMEGPHKEAYSVMAIGNDNSSSVYARH